MNRLIYAALLLLLQASVSAQTEIDLRADHGATLTVFTADGARNAGTGIIVIPGGAYGFLAFKEEGLDIARAFAQRGITAFVLKYRLPAGVKGLGKSTIPLDDARQAMRYVRQHARQYHIDTARIGVIGFSAGGHLAATLGTITTGDEQPKFMVLVYPVISMENNLTHGGSRINLLGQNPSDSLVKRFSAEQQVTAQTPPTYLTHTSDDQIVSVYNSIAMYQALMKNNVDAELHLYPRGDHGFIQRLPVDEWLNPILLFLHKEKMLPETKQ